MASFRLETSNIIYFYHWLTPDDPLKKSTGLKIDPKNWDPVKKRPKSSHFKYKEKNITRELSRIENAFYEALNYFEVNGGYSKMKLTNMFNELLLGKSSKMNAKHDSRFLDFYEIKLNEYKSQNINNWKGYQTTFNHLKSYFGRNIPSFEDIDMSFYISYNEYLKKQNLSTNSISNHFKFIKAIMNKAFILKRHKNTEFQQFKLIREKADTIYLTEKEIQNIFDLDLSGYLDKARDYFLIGCYTGLRYEDWNLLTKSIIKDNIAIIKSTKTGEPSFIPIRPNVFRILRKYKKGILPPKPSNQKMNLYIKEVAKKAGIDEITEITKTIGGKLVRIKKPKHEWISTHCARRSFATILILKGIQHHKVMLMTGHKSLASFQRYVRFTELQASIEIRDSKQFKEIFGDELTGFEKLTQEEERKKKTLLLLH